MMESLTWLSSHRLPTFRSLAIQLLGLGMPGNLRLLEGLVPCMQAPHPISTSVDEGEGGASGSKGQPCKPERLRNTAWRNAGMRRFMKGFESDPVDPKELKTKGVAQQQVIELPDSAAAQHGP